MTSTRTSGHLLDVASLSIDVHLPGGRTRQIVSGLNLHVDLGETVGIVGESGSGKSLTARSLLRLLPRGVRATGRAEFAGTDLFDLPERRMARFRGSRLALLFQDPFTILNPVLRCGPQIAEGLRQGGLSRAEKRAEAVRRLAEVGLPESVADRYPFQLSGGMRQRVALAAALAGNPELLIADEPSTALDVTTQAEILRLLKRVQETRGMGLILITHDLRVTFSACDRIYVLYAGGLMEVGHAHDLEEHPLHPYTLGLLLSEPPVDKRLSALVAIPGSVPAADEVSEVCRFSPRCRWARDVCRAGPPPLRERAPGRATACVRIEEIDAEMVALRRSVVEAAAVREAAPSEALVEVRGVAKTFDPGTDHANPALKGVSLVIGAGESVGLVGESGSGKTTLARCLLGLEQPDEGEIRIAGVDASHYGRLSRTDLLRLRRAVQVVFQDPYSSLNPAHRVGFALEEALRMAGRRDSGETVTSLLDRVGLPASYATRRPVALSGGERQRVAIARALAVQPSVLVCDEPVSALDVSVQAQVLNLFGRLREELGLSYLFITHDLAVVRQVVDRVYVLYRGEIVEHGPVDRVLDAPEDAYTKRLIESVPSGERVVASAAPVTPMEMETIS
jgi:peptide/nickel transport system ATP-binding protein